MSITPRIIPTLLVENGNLVKTKRFRKKRYLGDPINAIKIFNEKGVDELCVLDIGSTKLKSGINMELLEKMASEAFMPLSYGGGISSLEQAKEILRLGYEKIVINTAFVDNPNLVREISENVGRQSVVIAIDYKKTVFGALCTKRGGKETVLISPKQMAIQAEKLGAGEILLYSVDRDGMRVGYDILTAKEVKNSISIPLIICGGANSEQDFRVAVNEVHNEAVAAGSMFVFYGKREAVLINYPECLQLEYREYWRENGKI